MCAKPHIGIGLDIGTFSVKAVQMLKKKGGNELVNFGIERIEGAGAKPEIVNAVTKAVAKAGIAAREVNVSVSGPAVLVRYITLPKMTAEELKGAITFEADKYIPFKIDEVILDSQILAQRLEGETMRVLLVAARKDFVDNLLGMLTEANLEAQLIDVDAFAVVNAFLANNPAEVKDRTFAFLNVGNRFTNINIISDGIPFFTRDVQVGGENITQALCDRLGMSPEEAANFKSDPKEGFEELQAASRPSLDQLVSEVRLSFDYYESQFEKGIDKIYLSGGTAGQVGVGKYLTDNLGLESEIWHPAGSFKSGPGVKQEELDKVKAELAVAIGLALREL